MKLYAESSAVLAWLLKESADALIFPLLASAEAVISSDLTLVECDRTIWRAIALGRARETTASEFQRRLAHFTVHWTFLRLSRGVVERARQPFPSDPIRALDALHIASALAVRPSLPDIAMLSLDDRVRRVAGSLGFPVLPS